MILSSLLTSAVLVVSQVSSFGITTTNTAMLPSTTAGRISMSATSSNGSNDFISKKTMRIYRTADLPFDHTSATSATSATTATTSVVPFSPAKSRSKGRSSTSTSTSTSTLKTRLGHSPKTRKSNKATTQIRVMPHLNLYQNKAFISSLSYIQKALFTIKQLWWCFPMIIISIIPLHSLVLAGEFAKMPQWWSFEGMAHLRNSPLLCSGFLGSNIFYFFSGLYLLNIIRVPMPMALPLQKVMNSIYKSNLDQTNESQLQSQSQSQSQSQAFHTAKDPILGGLVLASGFISLLYHTFQSLGNVGIAESLCFVDHGVAMTSFCYFVTRCGMPSLKTLSIGIPSLALLLFPGDSYPVIHSLWHVASAGTTISWAFDGVEKRRKFISDTLQERKGYVNEYHS